MHTYGTGTIFFFHKLSSSSASFLEYVTGSKSLILEGLGLGQDRTGQAQNVLVQCPCNATPAGERGSTGAVQITARRSGILYTDHMLPLARPGKTRTHEEAKPRPTKQLLALTDLVLVWCRCQITQPAAAASERPHQSTMHVWGAVSRLGVSWTAETRARARRSDVACLPVASTRARRMLLLRARGQCPLPLPQSAVGTGRRDGERTAERGGADDLALRHSARSSPWGWLRGRPCP